jgi:hypothetical protein
LQSGNHRLDSLVSTGAERCHRLQERQVIIADEMPQDVKLSTVLHTRELDPRDQLNAPPHGLGSGHRQGGDSVVVGDRKRRQADSCGGDDNFARRANPVGMRRVNVQISGTVTIVPG